jgi:hypothetical protein
MGPRAEYTIWVTTFEGKVMDGFLPLTHPQTTVFIKPRPQAWKTIRASLPDGTLLRPYESRRIQGGCRLAFSCDLPLQTELLNERGVIGQLSPP